MRDLDTVWDELSPWLEDKEGERKTAVRRFLLSIPIAIGLAVVAAGIAAAFQAPVPAIIIPAIALAAISLWIGSTKMTALRKTVKVELNSRMAQGFGLTYRENPPTPSRYDAMRRHGLLPNNDRRAFEDQFSGTVHGTQIELYEAHLEERRRSKNRTYYVTVFRGACIRIRFPRTIEGVTLVTRDKGIFNAVEGWGKSLFKSKDAKLERIGLVDPTFEKKFEVYGTDQVMARYLLTPSFMERLLELEDILKGKNVRCVFDESLAEGTGEGELLIAAETGNLFEPATLFTPLNTRDRVEALYKDIALIEQIAKTLLEDATKRMG